MMAMTTMPTNVRVLVGRTAAAMVSFVRILRREPRATKAVMMGMWILGMAVGLAIAAEMVSADRLRAATTGTMSAVMVARIVFWRPAGTESLMRGKLATMEMMILMIIVTAA